MSVINENENDNSGVSVRWDDKIVNWGANYTNHNKISFVVKRLYLSFTNFLTPRRINKKVLTTKLSVQQNTIWNYHIN